MSHSCACHRIRFGACRPTYWVLGASVSFVGLVYSFCFQGNVGTLVAFVYMAGAACFWGGVVFVMSVASHIIEITYISPSLAYSQDTIAIPHPWCG